MALTLVTPPASEPIALQEAKEHCRIDGTDEDALMAGLITAARDYVENVTGRQLVTATWDLTLDRFPCWPYAIDMPRAPLQSVTSISYVDTDGHTQTVSSATYVVSAPAGATAERGRISLAYSQVWPPTLWQANVVTVRFVAGYGNADAVPQALKQAMLLGIGHWYENRVPVISGRGFTAIELPITVDALLGPYRTWSLESPTSPMWPPTLSRGTGIW
jgi:uncharacterized phiE125 gp8 family phage protein